MDEEDPRSLILPASAVGTLEELIETRSGIGERLRTALDEHSAAEERLLEARTKLEDGQIGADDPDRFGTLESIVATLRKSDHETRLRLARKGKAELETVLVDQREALRPWTGEVDHLPRMTVPEPARIPAWKTDIETAQREMQRHDDAVERLTTDHNRKQAEIDAIKADCGVIDDEQATAIRSARDDAWTGHRKALDERTAEAFENAMKVDDELTDARLDRSGEIATLRESRRILAGTAIDLDRAIELRDTAKDRLRAVKAEIGDAILAMAAPGASAFPADFSLVQLEGWLDRRGRVLETRSRIRAFDQEMATAQSDGRECRDRIVHALAGAAIPHDPDCGLDVLLDVAQGAIEREKDGRAARRSVEDAVKDRERDVKRRARGLEEAKKADEAWTKAWDEALSQCWFGADGQSRSPGSVRRILAENAALAGALEKRDDLAHRVDEMEADKQFHVTAVKSIADELGMEIDTNAPIDTAEALRTRLETAKRNQRDRDKKTEDLQDAEGRRRQTAEQLAVDARRMADMTELFGVSTMTEVNEKRDQVERQRELRNRAADLERRILEALKLPSMAEAEAALAEDDADTLRSEIVDLEARFQDQDQHTRELFSNHARLDDAVKAIGGDDAAARLEEKRQTVLLEIEEKAFAHLRIKVGVEAAERALRRYRDKHRSSMMASASEAFRTISRGNYSSLSTQPAKDRDVLIGIEANGGSKIASQMSKGARFQLYLALRVAGYHEFVRSRAPLPFIADDIMETFDDFRAEEAFRLFEGMARVGQVIYMTHHRHLCEIAREVCPSATIHQLPDPTIDGTGATSPTAVE